MMREAQIWILEARNSGSRSSHSRSRVSRRIVLWRAMGAITYQYNVIHIQPKSTWSVLVCKRTIKPFLCDGYFHSHLRFICKTRSYIFMNNTIPLHLKELSMLSGVCKEYTKASLLSLTIPVSCIKSHIRNGTKHRLQCNFLKVAVSSVFSVLGSFDYNVIFEAFRRDFC